MGESGKGVVFGVGVGVFEAAENGGEDGLLIGGLVEELEAATGHKWRL